jgi:hypothetical protein
MWLFMGKFWVGTGRVNLVFALKKGDCKPGAITRRAITRIAPTEMKSVTEF